jgi:membrane protease YdiL (CAAX protease family)
MRALKQVGQLVVVALVALVGNQVFTAVDGNAPAMLAVGLATAVAALLAYAGVVRWTERRPVVELEPRHAAAGLGSGTLVGIVMFTAVVAVVALLGDYHVDGWGSASGTVGQIGFMAAAAVTEELMFRGVIFRALQERTGTWVSLAVTGALFGGAHLLNAHATLWGGLAIAIEAGGMLTAAYVATGKLWVPIGLHLGWNFAEAGIFSTVVSGNGSNLGMLVATISGPTAVSGGEFGPEASLISLACCLVVTAALLVAARRRGRIVPLARARRGEARTEAPGLVDAPATLAR